MHLTAAIPFYKLSDSAVGVWYRWELPVLAWMQKISHPVLDGLFVPISLLGEYGAVWVVTLVAMMLWAPQDRKRLAVRTAAAMIIMSVIVVVPLRVMYPRLRPHAAVSQVRPKGLVQRGSSFPSGHASSASLAAVAFGSCRRRWAWGFGFFALLMAFSRVYTGMHFPSDVITGGVIGLASGFLMLWYIEYETRAGARPLVLRSGEGPPQRAAGN